MSTPGTTGPGDGDYVDKLYLELPKLIGREPKIGNEEFRQLLYANP